jgi:outer membrane protein TolC
MPSFSAMLSGDSATAWDRTTIGLGFDGAENLELPVKTRKAAEVALAAAEAAGERFRAAKFALQRQVLDAWLALALADERARVAEADLELLRVVTSTATARVGAGGPQRALLQAQVEERAGEDRTLAAKADARAARAQLNALLGRTPHAPLDLGEELPEPRAIPEDEELLAYGVHGNPELAELTDRIAGREDALELARLMYLPNFNPFASLTGSVSRVLGVMVMLPTTVPEIRAGVAEAEALLAGARALERQAHIDHAAHLVAALVMLRDSARAAELFEGSVLPTAELLAHTAQQSYAAEGAPLGELIEARRALLEVRLVIAAARIERERRVAEVEEIVGADMETLVERQGARP